VSFAVITLRVAFQRMFIFVAIYFVIDSVRKLLDKPSYIKKLSIDCLTCREGLRCFKVQKLNLLSHEILNISAFYEVHESTA
jgi:hypothetical protein